MASQQPIPGTCNSCSVKLSPNAQFCHKCGKGIQKSSPVHRNPADVRLAKPVRAPFPPAPPPSHQNGFTVVPPDPEKRDEMLKAQQTLATVAPPKTNLRCVNKLGRASLPRVNSTEQQRRQTALANARNEITQREKVKSGRQVEEEQNAAKKSHYRSIADKNEGKTKKKQVSDMEEMRRARLARFDNPPPSPEDA